MRRILPGLIAAAIVGGVVYALWPKPTPVDMGVVEKGPMLVTVDEEGKTRIKERYVVSAPLAGQLRRIELDPGDPIHAGETLVAVIEPVDPSLLDTRSLAEAEARVKTAAAALGQAEPNLERARVALEFAQKDYQRKRALQESRSKTDEEVEAVEMLVRTRNEELKAAEFAEQIARFELEQAQAALTRSKPGVDPPSENPIDGGPRFEIRAPIDGVVLHVLEENAAVVGAGTPLIEVGDPRDMEVEVDLLSSDAVPVAKGAKATLEHWGGDRPLAGVVRLVEPAAFTKISALGVEEQRVNVIIDFADPFEMRRALGDGFRVETRIATWQADDVVKVPASALFRHDGKWAVFRVVNGRAVLTPIEVDHINALEAEVVGGLDVGQTVVLHPSDKVSDGGRVVAR